MKLYIENEKDFDVAIWMVTYNHGLFIEKAIESVMMQKTTFKYKLLIGEDCSDDNTRKTCRRLKSKYPDKIELFLHKENIGGRNNGVFIYQQCLKSKAKYIAMCEGDDYWTDPLKLQKQIDYLKVNKDVNIVHTDFDWLDEYSKCMTPNYYKKNNIFFTKKYEIKEWYLNSKARTLTFCFRKSALDGFVEILNPKWTVGDTALILHLIKDKYIGYINESTGVYRRNIGSASTLVDREKRFHYFKNGSISVKRFFYNHYQINDSAVEKKIEKDYYEGLFNVALPARRYKLFLSAFYFKLWHGRFGTKEVYFLIKQMQVLFKGFFSRKKISN